MLKNSHRNWATTGCSFTLNGVASFIREESRLKNPGPIRLVPAQVAEGKGLIGLERSSIQPLEHPLAAGDGVWIAYQIGSIGLTRVRGIAVYGDVKRVSRCQGQDSAETPTAQDRVDHRVEIRTEAPSTSIGDLPNFAQHERMRHLRVQEAALLTEIRRDSERWTQERRLPD